MDSRVRVCVPKQTPTVSRFPSIPARVTFVTSFRYFGYGRLWIGERDGWFYEMEAEHSQGVDAGIYCHKSLEVATNVKIDISGKSVELNPQGAEKMRSLRTAAGSLSRELFMEVIVTEDEIDRQGGILYIPSLDIIVSRVCPQKNNIHHPYSSLGQLQPGDTLDVEGDRATRIRVKLVDNSRVIGNKWFKLGALAQQLEPEINPHLKDGLYVSTNDPNTEGWEHKYFPLPEVLDGKCPIKLHDSRSEALSEDTNKELELEIARLKREGERGKQEHEINKISKQTTSEAEKMLLELLRVSEENRERDRKYRLETELREAELIRKQREAEHKEFLEARAERRKNFTDFIKMVPAIISLGVALLALYKKSK